MNWPNIFRFLAEVAAIGAILIGSGYAVADLIDQHRGVCVEQPHH